MKIHVEQNSQRWFVWLDQYSHLSLMLPHVRVLQYFLWSRPEIEQSGYHVNVAGAVFGIFDNFGRDC